MGIIARQSTFNAIWIYVGIAIGYLNAGHLFPKFLGVPEYGMTRLILSWSSFALLVVAPAFPAAMLRYMPRLTKDQQVSLLSAFMSYSLVVGLLLSVALAIAGPGVWRRYDDGTGIFVQFGFLILPYTIALAYMSLWDAYLRLELRSVIATFWTEVGARLPNTLIILAYMMDWIDLSTFFYAYALAPLVPVAGMWMMVKQRPRWQVRWWKEIPWRKWKEIVVYTAYSAFTGVPSLLYRHVDMILVGKLLSLAKAGIYGLTILFSVLVESPFRAMGAIYAPLMSYHMANRCYQDARILFMQAVRGAFLMDALIALGLLVNIPWILSWIKPAYSEVYPVFTVLMWVPLIRALYLPLNVVFSYSPYYRWLLWVNVVGIIFNIMLDIWMIPRWGLRGAAVASVMAVLVQMMGVWGIGLRKLGDVVYVPDGAWKWIAGVVGSYVTILLMAQWWGSMDPRFWIVGNGMVMIYAVVLWRWMPEIKEMILRKRS